MTLRVLIADDELLARKRLTRLLGALPEVELVGECISGEAVLAKMAEPETEVDVLILDIQMGELSGVETMGLLPDGPIILFATAHSEYAVDAFDGGAADYLLKPVEPARLKKALDRARERLSQRQAPQPSATGPDRLAVPTRKGIMLIDPNTVQYALIEGESVILKTDSARFITDFRIADIEKKLPPERFERVHRKALLNLEAVATLEPLESGGYYAHTKDGAKLPVSRQSARKLRKLWGLPRS